MNIREMSVNGQRIIPPLELNMEKGIILGIQTNVQRKKILLAQFAERRDMYLSFAEQGEYTRLTVEELLRFMKSLSGHRQSVHSMLQLFQLGEYRKVKIADLPASKKTICLCCAFITHSSRSSFCRSHIFSSRNPINWHLRDCWKNCRKKNRF